MSSLFDPVLLTTRAYTSGDTAAVRSTISPAFLGSWRSHKLLVLFAHFFALTNGAAAVFCTTASAAVGVSVFTTTTATTANTKAAAICKWWWSMLLLLSSPHCCWRVVGRRGPVLQQLFWHVMCTVAVRTATDRTRAGQLLATRSSDRVTAGLTGTLWRTQPAGYQHGRRRYTRCLTAHGCMVVVVCCGRCGAQTWRAMAARTTTNRTSTATQSTRW